MNKHIETAVMASIPFIIAWAGGLDFERGTNLALTVASSIVIAVARYLWHKENS